MLQDRTGSLPPLPCRRSPRSGGELCRFRLGIRRLGQRLAQ
jgi:hypothetical protein